MHLHTSWLLAAALGAVASSGCSSEPATGAPAGAEAAPAQARTEAEALPPAPERADRAAAALASGDVPSMTRQLIQLYQTIQLTPEQAQIETEALQGLPAPCCASFSALTCCCECNLSRTVWGLSRFLITQGQDARQVRAAVEGWLATVNPAGHSGRSCFNGGCGRPFAEDGCGGMDPDRVVFGG